MLKRKEYLVLHLEVTLTNFEDKTKVELERLSFSL